MKTDRFVLCFIPFHFYRASDFGVKKFLYNVCLRYLELPEYLTTVVILPMKSETSL